jgi:hypothetical protein
MASSPTTNNFVVKRSSSDASSSASPTKERTNTADSNILLSPSPSNDFDSVADDSQQDDDHNHDECDDDFNNLEGSEMGPGMLLDAVLAPGESSSPSRLNSGGKVAGNKIDLCGSIYKRRGGFGRNKENNWYVI